jgi:kynurenine formamidase
MPACCPDKENGGTDMVRRRFVDLSMSIEADLPSDPPMMIPQIEYIDHARGAVQMQEFFPGMKKEQLPGGLGWALERLTLTTHSGTHLDAPYHYHPTMDRGKPALTIDEVALSWCFSDGVLMDFRHKGDGERITVKDLEKELDRIGYEIKPQDIVLIQTGADGAWGTPDYLLKGAGMDRESTLFLTEHGVRVMGIDAWSWDRPLPFLAKEFQQTKDPGVIWEAHFAGIEIGYCHMEKMANLSAIGKPYGFTVCCFPIKIKGASAAWVRPVAIVDED